MHCNVMISRYMDVVFTKLGFAIKKGASGTACCPFTFYFDVISIWRLNRIISKHWRKLRCRNLTYMTLITNRQL
ncbi:hypothetical protein HanIR_Chr02g0091221 [Helianthus annuus]|nr:hypothetical protein HanIR_Chr02g0091221 [Helianthus annuus]